MNELRWPDIPLKPHSGCVSLASRLLREASCPADPHSMHYTYAVCVRQTGKNKWKRCCHAESDNLSNVSSVLFPTPLNTAHLSAFVFTSVWMLCFYTFCTLPQLSALKVLSRRATAIKLNVHPTQDKSGFGIKHKLFWRTKNTKYNFKQTDFEYVSMFL